MMNKSFFITLLGTCALSFGSAHAAEQCTYWGAFKTQAKTNMLTLNQPSKNTLLLSGHLLYRPLHKLEHHYWLGLQLINPEVKLDQKIIDANLYGVPFAVKIHSNSGEIIEHHFAGKLKPEDKQKLIAIYQSLHIAHIQSRDLSQDPVLLETDSLGQYKVQYKVDEKDIVTRAKQSYVRAQQSPDLLNFNLPNIKADQFKLAFNRCGLIQLGGFNQTLLQTKKGDIRIDVEQTVSFKLSQQAIPVDTLLLALPNDPLRWPQLSSQVLYPRPPAKPMKDAHTFIAHLSGQDLTKISSDALAQLLYDNEIYLLSLKDIIKQQSISDKSLSRLLMMIGKNDSANAHQLLVDVFLDDEITSKQRFRSLMGLKYAEQPIAPELVDLVFEDAKLNQSGENARLSNSAMMVLGVIAKNQTGTEFARRVNERLVSSLKQTSQVTKQVGLLAALGNSSDAEQQQHIAPFLTDNNAKLRQQAAQALGNMPNEESLSYLTKQLSREQNTQTQAAIIKAMGNNQLDTKQLDGLLSYSKDASKAVRLAAVQALGKQTSADQSLKPQLKSLIKGEKDQQVLRALMKAVYSN